MLGHAESASLSVLEIFTICEFRRGLLLESVDLENYYKKPVVSFEGYGGRIMPPTNGCFFFLFGKKMEELMIEIFNEVVFGLDFQ